MATHGRNRWNTASRGPMVLTWARNCQWYCANKTAPWQSGKLNFCNIIVLCNPGCYFILQETTGKTHACIWENVCKYQALLELEQKPALLFLGQNKQSKSFSLNNIFCCFIYFFSESLCSRRVTFLEKIMLNCYLIYDVKVYFNWINILYIKNKIVKELEENVGN